MLTAMSGASRDSLSYVRERLQALVEGRAAVRRAGEPAEQPDLAAVGAELFAFVQLLDREARLRRLLSDPAQPGSRKSALLRELVGSQLREPTLMLLDTLVRARWSRSGDLVDAAEVLAVEAQAAAAERAGELDDLEDELFRFGRIIDANPPLRIALSDRAAPLESRLALVDALVDDKVTATTRSLVRQAVAHPRGRTLDGSLDAYGRLAAQRRQRLVAVVRTAVDLTNEQRQRLADALAGMYGHEVQLNVDVDPSVVGGLVVRIGDEVVDGTMATRLAEARRLLAG